jgi:lysophospholipase L1-like esterase
MSARLGWSVVPLALAFTLAACGGGGSDAGDPPAGSGDVVEGPDAAQDEAGAAPDGTGADVGGPNDDARTVPPDVAADAPAPWDTAPALPDARPADVERPDAAPDGAEADDGTPHVLPDVPGDVSADVPAAPPCPAPEALAPAAVSGRLYEDGDESAKTLYVQTFDPREDTPLADTPIALLDGAGERTTTTCADGTFAFGGLTAGLYVLDPGLPAARRTTSTNRGARFATAIREGHVRIVAFGDSVPVYSPDPPFPERLGALLAPLADASVTNVAVSGSRSVEWLPDQRYFRERLRPHLADADVVVFTLGGNDVLTYLWGFPADQAEAFEMLAGVPALIDGILVNVEAIVAAVHAENPQADIVYCLYPDYPASSYWEDSVGPYIGLVQLAFANELAGIRATTADLDGIVLADLHAATRGRDLDTLLIDPLHLSDEGADLYAVEVFRALGGVIVTPDEAEPPRLFGFAPETAAR